MFNPFIIISAFIAIFRIVFEFIFVMIKLFFQIINLIFNISSKNKDTLENNESLNEMKKNVEVNEDFISVDSVKKLRSELFIYEEQKIELIKKIEKYENDLLIEIDKQKKLLEHNAISNEEYQSRIEYVKNQLFESKNSLEDTNKKLKPLNELNDKVKIIENEVNIKFEKQKKLLNMNLIDKKEYDEQIVFIENELNERVKDLKI